MGTEVTDLFGISDPFAQNVLKSAKAKGEVEAAEKQEKAYGQQELAKAEAETTKKFAEEFQPKELKEKYEKTVDELGKPFIPTQQTAGDLGTIFAMTNILGFLIGGGAKGSAQAALSAQNGMLEGYQKGQMDVYKKQKDVFDENQKALSKAVEGLRDELKRAADTASVNKELGLAQAREAIAKHQAKQMGDYLDKMGVAATYELSEKAWQINEKLKAEKRAEEDRAERRANEQRRLGMEQERLTLEKERATRADYEYVVGKDGKTYAVNKRDYRDVHEVTGPDLSGATKLGAKDTGGLGSATQQRMMRVTQQDVDNAAYNLNKLKKISEQKGEFVGGSPAFANVFKGTTMDDVSRYIRTQVIPGELQGVDALLLNMAFDIASAQSGGSGQLAYQKIKELENQMPLDSEPLETKEIKWGALVHRLNAANDTLPEDKRKDLSVFTQYFGDEPIPQKTPSVTKQQVTPQFKAQNPEIAAERQKAQEAINNGKDPNAVRKRFKEKTGEDL
jgi:hypothetical protein